MQHSKNTPHATHGDIGSSGYDVNTFRRLRRAIGYLGIALPVVLVVCSLIPFFDTSIQPSISHYYYTNLRELFTGTLCAVGLFLIRYEGYGSGGVWWRNDNLLTNIAGFMAFGVALIPTDPLNDGSRTGVGTLIPYDWGSLNWFHYGFAAILFLSFSILSIFVFTLGQKKTTAIPKSSFDENTIYRVCGYAIIVFVVMVPVLACFKWLENSTLILEALSLFAFGTSWLIKGRALGQSGAIGEMLYHECHR